MRRFTPQAMTKEKKSHFSKEGNYSSCYAVKCFSILFGHLRDRLLIATQSSDDNKGRSYTQSNDDKRKKSLTSRKRAIIHPVMP